MLPSGNNSGPLKVALFVVVIAALVLGGWLISTLTDQSGSSAISQTPTTTDGTYTDGSNDGGTQPTDGSTSSMSDAESYDALMAAYNRAVELGDEVGKARTDGTYGGTGFAYDVFNAKIGDSNSSVRQDLVDECAALLDKVQTAKSEAEGLQVSGVYQQDKQEVVDLYGLLVRRAEILSEAAQAALNGPEESNWRPILTPASTDARVAYQNAVDGARPNQY